MFKKSGFLRRNLDLVKASMSWHHLIHYGQLKNMAHKVIIHIAKRMLGTEKSYGACNS